MIVNIITKKVTSGAQLDCWGLLSSASTFFCVGVGKQKVKDKLEVDTIIDKKLFTQVSIW